MNSPTTIDAIDRTTTPLRISSHVLIGLAIALVAPFTGNAWPFAILTGIVIGRAEADRARGIAAGRSVRLVQFLAVTAGVLLMLIYGAILGGLISFVVAALAAFSERVAGDATQNDRVVARIALVVAAVIGYLILLAIGVRVDIRLG
jgi:hypothetical protein